MSLFLGNVSRSKCSPSAPPRPSHRSRPCPGCALSLRLRGHLVCFFGLCSYALHSRGSSLGIAVHPMISALTQPVLRDLVLSLQRSKPFPPYVHADPISASDRWALFVCSPPGDEADTLFPSYPRHAHGDLTSLAPHERLPEILVVPREKTPTGAAARPQGSPASSSVWREDPGLLSRPCRKRRPSAREDGGFSGVSSSCGARGGFLPRNDEDLREPLVWRQGSQVSMRVADRKSVV